MSDPAWPEWCDIPLEIREDFVLPVTQLDARCAIQFNGGVPDVN